MSRYIDTSTYPRANTPALKQTLKKCLEENYHRVNRHTVAKANHSLYTSGPHVYVGLVGIAVMHNRVQDILPDIPRSSPFELLDVAIRSCSYIQDPTKPLRHCSSLETDIGVAEFVVTSCLQSGSPATTDTLAHSIRLLHKAKKFAVQSSSTECEFLYGRAGLLACLIRIRNILESQKHPVITEDLRSFCGRLVDDASTSQVIHAIIQCGRKESAGYTDSPLMWSWHSKRYLGAAHGVAGILHVLMSSPRSLLEPFSKEIIGTIQWLVTLQDSQGNWPTKAPRKSDQVPPNDLVQWCHGAPGICISLATCLRLSRTTTTGLPLPSSLQDQVLAALTRSSSLIYSRGLLTKGRGLCHGVGGSVYALLAISQAFQSSGPSADLKALGRELIARAAHLGYLVTLPDITSQMTTPDRPWSLYEGLAGMCCAWSDILRALNGQEPLGMPAFDDLMR